MSIRRLRKFHRRRRNMPAAFTPIDVMSAMVGVGTMVTAREALSG